MREVIALRGNYWTRLREVARRHRMTTLDDDKALAAAAALPKRVPTEFQAARVMAVLRRVKEASIVL